MKEIYLLILKHLREGQESVGTLPGDRSWQVPFLCSLSTLLVPLYVPHPHATSASLPKPVDTCSVPLEHLAQVSRGDCVLGPHESETIRETILGRLPHSSYYTDS